jgi:hypothetical protein
MMEDQDLKQEISKVRKTEGDANRDPRAVVFDLLAREASVSQLKRLYATDDLELATAKAVSEKESIEELPVEVKRKPFRPPQ